MELLSASYTFRVSYGGATLTKQQDIATAPVVTFQTVPVHSDSGTCTQYYAAGWKPFTQDMQLLPGAYTFRFSDGTPAQSHTISADGGSHIH